MSKQIPIQLTDAQKKQIEAATGVPPRRHRPRGSRGGALEPARCALVGPLEAHPERLVALTIIPLIPPSRPSRSDREPHASLATR
jgi:hypothetical protein